MAALQQNFQIFAGDGVTLEFPVVDQNGNPYDLTGVQLLQWAMGNYAINTPLITKDSGSIGGITVGSPPTAGIFYVQLNSADTKNLPGFFYHEARLTDSSGIPRVVASGIVTIQPSNL
jgi:hypothetical protein